VVVPGYPHHLTQRGVRGSDVFLSDDQRQQYLIWLAEYATECSVGVWAYCLMSNHVHIIAVPGRETSFCDMMRTLQMRHSQAVNAFQGTTGHVWQGRYYCCTLDADHAVAAVRYVEQNPVRAGMVDAAEEHDWNSAQPHCGLRGDPVLDPEMPMHAAIDDWQLWLHEEPDYEKLNAIRNQTFRGFPCGHDRFIQQCGRIVGRKLVRSPRGRPKLPPDYIEPAPVTRR
jgi:putative transposase